MKRGTWMRRLGRVGIGFALALVLLVGAWMTGVPQERAIAWAVERNLGAVAVVEWGGFAPDLRLERVELYPNLDARRANEPLLVAEGVSVSYSLHPSDGRRVRTLRVRSLTLALDARDPEHPNYAFLLPDDDAESAPMEPTYLPIDVAIERVSATARIAEGDASLGPASVSAKLIDASTVSATYRADASTATWQPADESPIQVDGVDLVLDAQLEEDRIVAKQELNVREAARASIEVSVDMTQDDPVVHAKVGECRMMGSELSRILDAARLPLHFNELDVEDAEGEFVFAQSPRFSARAVGHVRAPSLPGAREPLYDDVATLEFDAEQADRLSATTTLTWAEGQHVVASVDGDAESGSATLESGQWTRDQLLAALPSAFRGSVEGLGFDAFTARADVEWTEDGFVAKANAASQGSGAESDSIYWALDAKGPRDTVAGVEGTLVARLGDRRINAQARYVGQDEYRAEAQIEEVQLAPWVRLFAGDAAAEEIAGTIEGTIIANAAGEDAPLVITPDVHLRTFAYGDVDLDEITMAGTMDYDAGQRRLVVKDLHADSIDGMTRFQLTDFTYLLDESSGEGVFEAGANLNVIGTAMGMPELFGSSAYGDGRIRMDESTVTASCTLFSDYLGWDEILLPYGETVSGDVAFEYQLERGEGRLVHCQADIGAGTTVHLVDTAFTLDPLSVTGKFECDSDLQIAVPMGWLDSVEGSLEERSAFRIDEEGFSTDWNLRVDSAKLVLPENAGSAEGISFQGSGTYRDGLTGDGQVRAAKLTAAGGFITNASGPATFEGDTMRISPARGTLFGGGVTAEVTVGVLAEDIPIALTGSFDAVDLAVLTDEVQPPNTSLTGTAIGTISAGYSAKGLEAFTLDASAPDGLSVNRSLVSDLLQSDRFLAGAGERVAQRAMDKLLGSAAQRPFDTGRMHVYLDSGKIQGTAELRSVKTDAYNGLNLTVNLDMDQSALAEALALLEESNLGNVDF